MATLRRSLNIQLIVTQQRENGCEHLPGAGLCTAEHGHGNCPLVATHPAKKSSEPSNWYDRVVHGHSEIGPIVSRPGSKVTASVDRPRRVDGKGLTSTALKKRHGEVLPVCHAIHRSIVAV